MASGKSKQTKTKQCKADEQFHFANNKWDVTKNNNKKRRRKKEEKKKRKQKKKKQTTITKHKNTNSH